MRNTRSTSTRARRGMKRSATSCAEAALWTRPPKEFRKSNDRLPTRTAQPGFSGEQAGDGVRGLVDQGVGESVAVEPTHPGEEFSNVFAVMLDPEAALLERGQDLERLEGVQSGRRARLIIHEHNRSRRHSRRRISGQVGGEKANVAAPSPVNA